MTWEELPIAKIEQVIGYEFKNKDLLRQAFTSTWYWYDKTGHDHNLPYFIGNAIIKAQLKYLHYHKQLTDEEFNEINKLYYVAWHDVIEKLGFNDYIIKSSKDGINPRQDYYDLGNIFPLLVCAVYFDQNQVRTNKVNEIVTKIIMQGKEEKQNA